MLGWEALGIGHWEEARDYFEAAVVQEVTPEALEGLGWAASRLYDVNKTFNAWHSAYRGFNERNDRRGAARTATWLATNYFVWHGKQAVSNGWIRRARRLLEGLELTPEHAMVAVWEAYMAILADHDTVRARELCRAAASQARELGIFDVEMLALAIDGYARVNEGDVDEGLRLLDEATAAAVSGEMSDLDSVTVTCCFLIYACERVGDFKRASQWCETVLSISQRWTYESMFAFCRTHVGGLYIWRGDWKLAEIELTEACDVLSETHPAMAFEGILRLAELRRRQGRFAEAGLLLDQAEQDPLRMLAGHMALLSRAALALDLGDPTAAADLAERYLRWIPSENRLEKVLALQLLIRAQIADGVTAAASETLDRMNRITSESPTTTSQAASSIAAGLLAVVGGRDEEARRHFEDTIDRYTQVGGPFEAAQARTELAGVLTSLGRHSGALVQARSARETLERLGAAPEAARAARIIDKLEQNKGGARQRPQITARVVREPESPNRLSKRERQIAALIVQGLSNRQIAAELSISPATAERHVSNIFNKLGFHSRAQIAAWAVEHNLIADNA